jgi:hypothetical protein
MAGPETHARTLAHRLAHRFAAALLALSSVATQAASSPSASQTSPERDNPTGAPATQQVKAFATGQGPCDDASVKQALALVYQQDDLDGAARLAAHCLARGQTQGHALDKTIGLRIQALIAMRTQDLAALKFAGESLVSQAPVPEYVADGHLFIAMACVLGGQTQCARTHVDHARALFTQLQVSDALTQLQPLETAVLSLEALSK